MARQRCPGRCCARSIESRLSSHRHCTHLWHRGTLYGPCPAYLFLNRGGGLASRFVRLLLTRLNATASSRPCHQKVRHPPLRNLHHHQAMEQLSPSRRCPARPRSFPQRPRHRLPRPLPHALALSLRTRRCIDAEGKR